MSTALEKAKPASRSIRNQVDKNGRLKTRLGRRTAELYLGLDKVEDWDDEELQRGYRRDRNGLFRGKPPTFIPTQAHRELLRRRLREAEQILVTNLPKAIKTLVAIMESPAAEDKDRIAAAKLVIERVMGKALERVEVGVTVDPPWMDALKAGIVDMDEDDDIIDTDAVELADEDDDDYIFED